MIVTQYQKETAALDRCAAACASCASACIAEGRFPDMEKCVRLDLDCAALCRFTSEAIARDTQFMRDFCDLCARICDACADECGRHPAQHCRICSDACRVYAEACRAT
ncbi:four-helix bundle copper-binding protein [Caballeronia sp. LZ035]|nr:four-helix bundle copper-binding protein [Caballeronia sp. LZ035]